MSRAYRIHIAESLRRHVEVDGGVDTRLDILPILAPERMAELLADELARRGFEQAADRAWVLRPSDGVEVRIDPEDGTVHARVVVASDLEAHADEIVSSAIADPAERERVERARARHALEAETDRKAQALRRDASIRAADALDAIRPELDAAATATTRRALEERAAQLGEIRSIEEDPATGAVTIRVRV